MGCKKYIREGCMYVNIFIIFVFGLSRMIISTAVDISETLFLKVYIYIHTCVFENFNHSIPAPYVAFFNLSQDYVNNNYSFDGIITLHMPHTFFCLSIYLSY